MSRVNHTRLVLQELMEAKGTGLLEAKERKRKFRLKSELGKLRATGTLEEKVDWLLKQFEEHLK